MGSFWMHLCVELIILVKLSPIQHWGLSVSAEEALPTETHSPTGKSKFWTALMPPHPPCSVTTKQTSAGAQHVATNTACTINQQPVVSGTSTPHFLGWAHVAGQTHHYSWLEKGLATQALMFEWLLFCFLCRSQDAKYLVSSALPCSSQTFP